MKTRFDVLRLAGACVLALGLSACGGGYGLPEPISTGELIPARADAWGTGSQTEPCGDAMHKTPGKQCILIWDPDSNRI